MRHAGEVREDPLSRAERVYAYMVDPIANFITGLKNAALVGKETVTVPYSTHLLAIAEILRREGYLEAVAKKGKKVTRFIEVTLASAAGKPVLSGVRRRSKPSRRSYVPARNIRRVRSGFGHLILSTPKGVLTDREARKLNVGGEALFEIW